MAPEFGEGEVGELIPKLTGIDRYGSAEGSDQQASIDEFGGQYVDKSTNEQGAMIPKTLYGMDVSVRTSSFVSGY